MTGVTSHKTVCFKCNTYNTKCDDLDFCHCRVCVKKYGCPIEHQYRLEKAECDFKPGEKRLLLCLKCGIRHEGDGFYINSRYCKSCRRSEGNGC